MSAASPAEWAEAASIALALSSATAAVFFVLVDADLADFDPRPAARRALTVTHQLLVHAGHDLNRLLATVQRLATQAAPEAAVTAAAFLALLLPVSGATR